MKIYFDKLDQKLSDGDIIDINQTVNGVRLFFVYFDKFENEWEVKYYTPHSAYRHGDKYEYDVDSLLSPCRLTGEVDYEIIGNIKDWCKSYDEYNKLKEEV